MKASDFLIENTADVWSSMPTVNRDLLAGVADGSLRDVDDIEVADAVIQFLHQQLEAFGTNGGNAIDDSDLLVAMKAAHVSCSRVGLTAPQLPFKTLDGFYKYWNKHDMKGSWAARREYLDEQFAPVESELFTLITASWEGSGLAEPVSPHGSTGWATVDREIRELRRRFEVARTPQDHSAVGTACVRVLEDLGEAAFKADVMLESGMPVPARDKTKARFDAIVAYYLPGADNEIIRKLARSAVEAAQEVKHRKTPKRRDAGLAADSVIMLANMLRRLDAEDQT